jgi:hypothetical protein
MTIASVSPVPAIAALQPRSPSQPRSPDRAGAPAPADAGDQEAVPGSTATPRAAGQAAGDATRRGGELTPAQAQLVSELQSRDREVRAHEAAHQAAGGGLVGSASFTYEQGPDGHSYAVGGEVPVDLSSVPGDPQATIARMALVRAAALAPAQPSGQDQAVAAAAAAIAAQAQQELTSLHREASNREAPQGAGPDPAGGADGGAGISARQRQAVAAYARAGGSGPGAGLELLA